MALVAYSTEDVNYINSSIPIPKEQSKHKNEPKGAQSKSGFRMTTRKMDLADSSGLLAANLWDEAYGDLKSQEPDQLKRYEETVLLWLESNCIKTTLHQPLADTQPDGILPAGPWRQWLCLQVRENYACQ